MITLSELRKQKGLTQRELAEKLGVGISTIAMYETGSRIPSLKKARQIADYFEIPLEEIFFGETAHETGASSSRISELTKTGTE